MGRSLGVQLALAACAAGAVMAEVPEFRPPTFTLRQLQSPDARTLEDLAFAIENVGLLSVTEWEEGDAPTQPFYGALHDYVACARGPLPAATLNRVLMDDGTARHTLATSCAEGEFAPLPAAAVAACPAFAHKAERLRGAIDATGLTYAQVLDDLVYGGAPPSADSSFAAAAAAAESLEHFHMFTHADAAAAPATTTAEHAQGLDPPVMLPLHTDMGMFLVMTAAEYFDLGTAGAARLGGTARPRSTGLVLELPSGARVAPALPEGSLLVLNGEAATRWMAAGALRPAAAPHEVLAFDADGAGNDALVRAWFGRMYFPHAHAPLRAAPGEELQLEVELGAAPPLTFGAYRHAAYEAFRRGEGSAASAAGCTPAPRLAGLKRVLADEASCGADEVFCWMACRAMPADLLCAPAETVCRNPTNDTFWPTDYTNSTGQPTHCFDCVVQCPMSDGTYGVGIASEVTTADTSGAAVLSGSLLLGALAPALALLAGQWALA